MSVHQLIPTPYVGMQHEDILRPYNSNWIMKNRNILVFEKQPRRGEILIAKTLNYDKAPEERYII